MNIAICSCWHVHARSYIKQALGMLSVKIGLVWDENEARGRKWAEELNCRFVSEYQEVLEDDSIDGVLICAPTSQHGRLMIQAAQAGKHIFTEKLLTVTAAEAEAVEAAITEAGVRFAISFPHKARRELLFMKKLVEDGTLGTLTYARVHHCHNGSSADWLPESFYDPAQSGGGAMADLGAHGMYLLPWFLGKPLQVQSTFTQVTGRGVEDNAVSVLTFEGGAIGVCETGFVQRYDPMTVEVVGTEGAVRVRGEEPVQLCDRSTGGVWIDVPESKLPPPLPSALEQWVNAVELRMGTLFDIQDAAALTRVMEAAYEAARTGQNVKVPHKE